MMALIITAAGSMRVRLAGLGTRQLISTCVGA